VRGRPDATGAAAPHDGRDQQRTGGRQAEALQERRPGRVPVAVGDGAGERKFDEVEQQPATAGQQHRCQRPNGPSAAGEHRRARDQQHRRAGPGRLREPGELLVADECADADADAKQCGEYASRPRNPDRRSHIRSLSRRTCARTEPS